MQIIIVVSAYLRFKFQKIPFYVIGRYLNILDIDGCEEISSSKSKDYNHCNYSILQRNRSIYHKSNNSISQNSLLASDYPLPKSNARSVLLISRLLLFRATHHL